MGLYRTLARPVFFSLSPEGAHHLAQALLRMPLPWKVIGGVLDDPRLHVDLAGIPLRNPVGLAAGFDKNCRVLPALSGLGFGYLVGGTVTREPRRGNPKPRIVRKIRTRSIVNAMGLPNKGAAYAAGRLARTRDRAPTLVSLADEPVGDVVANHAVLEPLVDGFELNVSCPNVSWGRDRDNEQHLRDILEALRSRSKPLFVKLPPFETPPERDAVVALAGIAQELGAEGLTCSNTKLVTEPRLSTGSGGVSGRELFDGTLRVVAEVRRATGGALPVNACGGVFSAEDAMACFEAGATTVQVYTGFIYEGPQIVRDITGRLARELEARGIKLADVVGAMA
jgi:dihydroorotate dehydrogenase